MFERLKQIPTYMDYDGQRKAEKVFQSVELVFAAVGLVMGYIYQQFSFTVLTLIAGFVVSCILTLPPWPGYRRKPLNWLKPAQEEGADNAGSLKAKKKK